MKRREVKEGEKKEKQGQYWQLQFRGGTPHPVSCTPPLPCTPRPSPSSLTHPIIKQYRNYIKQQQKFICQQRQDGSVQMSWINPELSVCSQSLRVSQQPAAHMELFVRGSAESVSLTVRCDVESSIKWSGREPTSSWSGSLTEIKQAKAEIKSLACHTTLTTKWLHVNTKNYKNNWSMQHLTLDNFLALNMLMLLWQSLWNISTATGRREPSLTPLRTNSSLWMSSHAGCDGGLTCRFADLRPGLCLAR